MHDISQNFLEENSLVNFLVQKLHKKVRGKSDLRRYS